jgi:hypothetical protein
MYVALLFNVMALFFSLLLRVIGYKHQEARILRGSSLYKRVIVAERS